MRISSSNIRHSLAALTLTLVVGVSAPTLAFDPEKTFGQDDEPRTILRYGFKALKDGKMDDAIGAFRFGAEKNDLASQWKLARMLQTGEGAKEDHLAAYQLYVTIANRYAERFPRSHDLPYVSAAVVALGHYSLLGIKGTNITANPRRAERFFYRAAALYKDREAQYQLGSLYRHGVLGVKQPRSAVRWFGLSARKGHRHAQAELGEMLFYGEGVSPNPVRGLVYMGRATASNAHRGIKSIRKIRKRAFAKASAAQRAAAAKILNALKRDDKNIKTYALEKLPKDN